MVLESLDVLKRMQDAGRPVGIAQLKGVIVIFYPAVQVVKIQLQGIVAVEGNGRERGLVAKAVELGRMDGGTQGRLRLSPRDQPPS